MTLGHVYMYLQDTCEHRLDMCNKQRSDIGIFVDKTNDLGCHHHIIDRYGPQQHCSVCLYRKVCVKECFLEKKALNGAIWRSSRVSTQSWPTVKTYAVS
jgi:hypothetical protein